MKSTRKRERAPTRKRKRVNYEKHAKERESTNDGEKKSEL
jgi:hypothetical protein